MAAKIIFFMSDLKPDAKTVQYSCPVGDPVSGIQTNEAPTLYFLREHSNVTEIICIVTEKAMDTAYDHFCQAIISQYPQIKIESVLYAESDSFEAGPLSELIGYLDQKDTILLDTTGGFRNASMHLMLVSRVLSFRGNRLLDAVYANYDRKSNTGKIESVLPLFRQMDLISGMQDMTTHGTLNILESYYDTSDAAPAMHSLLRAAKKLQGALSVCDTDQILPYVNEVRNALAEAKETITDSLTLALLRVYESKFVKDFNTPGIIRWCLENNMLQQALTIYNVWIPEYLLTKREDLFYIEKYKLCPPAVSYKSSYETTFDLYVLNMSKAKNRACQEPSIPAFRDSDSQIETLLNLSQLLPESYVKIAGGRSYKKEAVDQIKRILADYMYVRLLRNRINHAFGSDSSDAEDVRETATTRAEKLKELYPTFPDIENPNPDEIAEFIRGALKSMMRKN